MTGKLRTGPATERRQLGQADPLRPADMNAGGGFNEPSVPSSPPPGAGLSCVGGYTTSRQEGTPTGSLSLDTFSHIQKVYGSPRRPPFTYTSCLRRPANPNTS